nr:EOG090X08BF [Eulimnadia texana]
MGASKLDHVYRSLVLSKFFVKGWGKPDNIKRLFDFRKKVSNREECYQLVDKNYPVQIEKEEDCKDHVILEGHFNSPFANYLPELVPEESRKAHFQIVLPKTWKWKNDLKPMCLHLAGTGDHFFWRRRLLMAKPLLNEYNIGSIILENPFYGMRKPKEQKRSCLHNVSDIFVMGGCLVLESLVLLHWCERNGFGPLGVTGISMGGHMASLAATNWPKPVVLVPCLSWSTASGVFTKGVMSGSIDWSMLETQYRTDSFYSEILKTIMQSGSADSAFEAGRQFARNYSRDNDIANSVPATNTQRLSTAVEETFPSGNVSSSRNLFFSNLTESVAFSSLWPLRYMQSWSLEKSEGKWKKLEKVHAKQEAIQFMRGIMDEFTHVANYSKPVDCSSIIIVTAKDDAYVPREGAGDLSQIWPGSEIRYVQTGHVGAYVLYHTMFRYFTNYRN